MRSCVHCGCLLEGDEIFLGVCERCWPKHKKSSGRTSPPERPSGYMLPPVPKTGPVPAAPERRSPARPPKPQGPKKILVIDDEPILVKLLAKRLQAAKYAVITAANGREGYEKIKAEKPDLVISDILMPEMTGYDLLQKLKKEKDGTQDIPVIIITAKGGMEKFFSNWEIHGYMTKPIDPAGLLAKIEELLKAAEAWRRSR